MVKLYFHSPIRLHAVLLGEHVPAATDCLMRRSLSSPCRIMRKKTINSSQNYLFTISLTHGDEPFVRSRQLCSYSGTSQHFMEPEGSLPCSQEPSTGPYPEPDRSSPYRPILLL
jgi:hypothetical protein